MCLVCVQWQAGKLTNKEAIKNLGELINTDGDLGNEHFYRVIDDIMDKELPTSEPDSDLDAAWHRETHKANRED